MSFPLMSDPISTLIFGQANGMKSMCKSKAWYNKGMQRMIRHIVRRMNNGPSDGKTDLKVCVPSIAVNIETDGLNNAKKFIPELACKNDDSDPACRDAKKDPLLKHSSDGTVTVRGLESTDRKACSYQLLQQFSQKSNGKWSMKAETGRKWLTTKIKLSSKFKKSACTQPNAIRTSIISKLKKRNYDLWQDLEPRHVLIQCTGYVEDGSSKRRLRVMMKVDASASTTPPRLLKEDQELSISIQLSEKQESEGIAATKETIGTPAAIAETLADAGVTDESGTPIKSADIAEVEVASETSDDIEVEKLPDDIASAIGDDTPTTEKKDEKTKLDWVIIGVLIGVGAMCLLMCAAGLFWFQCIRKTGSGKSYNKK